ETANSTQAGGVPRIAQRLVLHGPHPTAIGPGHHRNTASGVECLECPHRAGEFDRLDLRQCIDALRPAFAQHPRRRRVVVERALERIDDLIIERRFRFLGQAPHEDLHALGLADAADAFGGDDVDHAGGETAVGDHRDVLPLCGGMQRLLLLDDCGVAAQVGAVQSHGDSGLGDRIVEVVGQRIHDGVMPAHQRAEPRSAFCIEARSDQPLVPFLLKEGGHTARLQIGQSDALDFRVPQQVKRAGRTLQPSAQHEHAHPSPRLRYGLGMKRGKLVDSATVLHPSQPSPQTGAAELTRQRLIRAALELFTTRGYHVTTTAQIAKKAGIAEGTIYRHFASKQQLVNELYRAAQRWATKVAQEASRSLEPTNTRAQLAAVAHGLIEGATRDPSIVKLGLLEPLGAVLDDESRKTEREFRLVVERLIAEGKAQGVVRTGAVDVWAGVWLATIGYALQKIVAGEWKSGDAGLRLVIDGAWRAISA